MGPLGLLLTTLCIFCLLVEKNVFLQRVEEKGPEVHDSENKDGQGVPVVEDGARRILARLNVLNRSKVPDKLHQK